MTDDTIREVLNKFTNGIRDLFGERMRSVILYGSCARGDYAEDSDIDVMVLLDYPQNRMSEARRQVLDLSDELDLEYDVVLAPVFQNYDVFQRFMPVSAYYQNVKREGVIYA